MEYFVIASKSANLAISERNLKKNIFILLCVMSKIANFIGKKAVLGIEILKSGVMEILMIFGEDFFGV